MCFVAEPKRALSARVSVLYYSLCWLLSTLDVNRSAKYTFETGMSCSTVSTCNHSKSAHAMHMHVQLCKSVIDRPTFICTITAFVLEEHSLYTDVPIMLFQECEVMVQVDHRDTVAKLPNSMHMPCMWPYAYQARFRQVAPDQGKTLTNRQSAVLHCLCLYPNPLV